jgi:hypothetical protein
MGRIAILSVFILLLASAGFAPCFIPESRHVEYWQYDPLCIPGGSCTPRWFLRGTCDTDCYGNTSCSGDTHIDDQTRFVVTTGDCSNEICTD